MWQARKMANFMNVNLRIIGEPADRSITQQMLKICISGRGQKLSKGETCPSQHLAAARSKVGRGAVVLASWHRSVM